MLRSQIIVTPKIARSMIHGNEEELRFEREASTRVAMKNDVSARMELRSATREEHDRVDSAFSRFDLTDRRGYAAFLCAQAGAFLPLEAAIAASQPENILPDWAQRRRAALLRDDLADLGAAPGDVRALAPFATVPELLGTIYVLEGSRLGGALLSRTLPADFPRRFLGSSDSALWRKLIDLIDGALDTKNDRTLAVDAAKSAFARFEQSARNIQG